MPRQIEERRMKLFTWANCGPSKDGMDSSEGGFGSSTTYYHYYNYLLPTTAARGTCVYTHKLIGREATHTPLLCLRGGSMSFLVCFFLPHLHTDLERRRSQSRESNHGCMAWAWAWAWAWAETTEKNHRLWVGEWIYRTAELSAVLIA